MADNFGNARASVEAPGARVVTITPTSLPFAKAFVVGAPTLSVGAISGIALDGDTVTDAAAFSVVCACAGTPCAHRSRGVGTQSPTPATLRGRY